MGRAEQDHQRRRLDEAPKGVVHHCRPWSPSGHEAIPPGVLQEQSGHRDREHRQGVARGTAEQGGSRCHDHCDGDADGDG